MNTTGSFWNITSQGREAEIDIFGLIGDFGAWDESTAAADFIKELRGLGRVSTLNVNLHSEGGSVWDGLAIYRALRDLSANKVVHVASLSASIASVVMLAGDRIEVAPEATVMIHDPILLAIATSEQEAEAVPQRWRAAKSQILNVYERRTGANRDHLSDLMAAETWMVGDEIKEAGFADVVKPDQAKVRVAAGPISEESLRRWKRTPESIRRPKPAPLPEGMAARLEKVRVFK